MSVHLVLYEPEIPPNTGNIARLCAAMGIAMHLVEPLGFSLDNKQLKRAGLDYWHELEVSVWPDFDAYLGKAGQGQRLVATSAKQRHSALPLPDFVFTDRDSLVFGPETRGLPGHILASCACCVHIPIRAETRSLNLSTAAGIVLYAALAQLNLLAAPPAKTCRSST